MAPALGLPDFAKPFELFVHERQHLALGVLTQRLGTWKRPVGYFSKQLDHVSKRWPGCLRAVATAALPIQEAPKLTMGQKMTVCVPHIAVTVLEQKGGRWLSLSRMLKYQVVLLEQDHVESKTTAILNPAMFLTTENLTDNFEHDRLLTIEQVYSSRPGLRHKPLGKSWSGVVYRWKQLWARREWPDMLSLSPPREWSQGRCLRTPQHRKQYW